MIKLIYIDLELLASCIPMPMQYEGSASALYMLASILVIVIAWSSDRGDGSFDVAMLGAESSASYFTRDLYLVEVLS